MGLEEVKNDIMQDAEQEADRIVEEAEEKADEIISEAEREAEQIREKYQEELEQEKESYRRKAISNANMKARQEKLKAREEKLGKAFDQFRQRLENLSYEEKEEYVSSALDMVEFDVGKVVGGQEFEDAVDVEFEEKEMDGVIVVSEDGSKRQNFSFDKIIDQYRESYRKKVADILF